VVVVGASVPRPVVVSGAEDSVVAEVSVGSDVSESSLPPQAAARMAMAATVETNATRRRLAWWVVLTLLFPLLVER
jgi:hypothetical protein